MLLFQDFFVFCLFCLFFSLVGFPLRVSEKPKTSGRALREERGDQQQKKTVRWLKGDSQPLLVPPDSGALTVPAPPPPTRPLASSFLRPAALLHKPLLLTGPHPSAVERKQTQQAAGEKKERKVVKETHNLVFSSASLRAQSSRLSVPPPCWPVGVLVTPAGWKNATAHPAHRLRFFFFFF